MTEQIQKYIDYVKTYSEGAYKRCFREAMGKLNYPFIVPGASYSYQLWDWDSWLTDIALQEIAQGENISAGQKGCILNFLEHADSEGRIPINIKALEDSIFDLKPNTEVNIHKPCLAQHALFVVEKNGNDVSWLKDKFPVLERFNDWYQNNAYHEESGLYVWINDFAIGIDNDPCVFYRPNKSTAAIFLNCLMYNELLAMAKLADMLGYDGEKYKNRAQALEKAIQSECWDDRDGFYYSADVTLEPINPNEWLHQGHRRHWKTMPMRIGVWSGFLPMWLGIATKEQAKRIVEEHFRNERTFNSPYGIRSLSKAETRMYAIRKSGNPSCWLGPIWGNVSWFVFEGLLRYGYVDEARELAEKTVTLFGRDVEENGEFHEYYDPETGVGVNNKGFQSWNFLVYNMANWLLNNEK